MSKFFYGTNTKQIEVTDIVKEKCLNTNGNFISFPSSMNNLFSDPCPYKRKTLICKDIHGNIVNTLDEYDITFPKYRLAIGSIFKNESWNLKEWLEHYLREGVEHFYLIDNGSTDNYEEILKPYIEQNIVTLFKDSRRHVQERVYNTLIKPIAKKETEWLIICDLDEFIYSRKQYPRIIDYLNSLSKDVSIVILVWKMFGSSGFIKHPNSIVQNMTKRKLYNGQGTTCLGIHDPSFNYTKNIMRIKNIEHIKIHNTQTIKGIFIQSDGKRQMKNRILQEINERKLQDWALHLNHYAIQSKDFFDTVKKTRKSAAVARNDNKRDDNYFKLYDWNEHIDEELKNKKY